MCPGDIRPHDVRRTVADRLVNDLGVSHWKNGDLGVAEEILTEALAIRRRVSGRDHPETLAVLTNLALVHQGQGDVDGAIAEFREVLAGYAVGEDSLGASAASP